ncbi:hypothetical protein C1646_671816 [Rhizophagus diaphanus]|nr:hypothetical protein C1646_671816 [Rhizophagus diaphanus] [Rhizophagus sp. MUCL 43196]
MSVELLTHFSQNFSRYFDSTDESNVVIRVGKDDNTQNFNAHSLILKAQCPYFNAGLSSEWAKKEGNNIIFDKPNIEPEVFEIVLKYLYTGIITSIESQSPSFVIQLLCAADELILPEMISYVEDQFLLHHSSYLNENFSEILNIAFKRELWKKLQTYCLDQICPNPSIIFASPNFLSCSEAILSGLLQRDDLIMKEIEIWDILLKWGINQEPSIGEYHEEKMINEIVDKWSDKDFESLKERLKNCIPYIRFSDISPEDFFVRIRPLKKIFPDDVYEEVLWKYVNPKNVIFVNKREKETQEETLNFNARNNDKESSFPYLINYRNSLQPSRPSPIDSSIINLKHAALISSWVDRLSHPYRLASIPYQFRLLLRSTRDGFTAAEFHKKCDSFDKTVTVLRVKGTKEIFGGYNPLNWNGSGYKSTSESFIFSFEGTTGRNSFDLKNGFKLSRVRNNQIDHAIYSYANCGPQWGGNDLRAWGSFNADCCQCVHLRYEEAIRNNPDLFSAEEFEVFQLVKK